MTEKESRYTTHENLADEGKLIYVMGVPDKSYYQGWLKIGDTSEPTLELDNRRNSQDLRDYATKRIKQYMTTAGLSSFKVYWAELAFNKHTGHFFRDHDVHEVLHRSNFERGLGLSGYYNPGNEWFKLSLDDAKRAIEAVKNGYSAISNDKFKPKSKIQFRPEQRDFIDDTVKHYHQNNKDGKTMLWNAKMRFGKTLCALEVARKMGFRRTLIITHRPEVNEGWRKDFDTLLGDTGKYAYGSKQYDNKLPDLKKSGKKYFYFASLQDLTGSKRANGKYDKDNELFNTKWDFLIIDEAHEGTQTMRAKDVMKNLHFRKSLLLSGTPFNLLSNYKPDQICTWDYTQEQTRKMNWSHDPKHPNHTEANNPYSVLPKVNMFTFQIGKRFKDFYNPYEQFFNFNSFFATDRKTGAFIHKDYVKRFLENITTPNSRTNYPYSSRVNIDQVKHSLWVLPSRASAKALKSLMEQNSTFKKFYIVNVVDDNDNDANEDDVDRVEHAIHNNRYTITLTVRKMTLGVTVPEWTAVVFLADVESATQYLQAAFRAQSPYVKYTEKNGVKVPIYKKTNCYIFDFAPERALTMVTQTVQLNPQNRFRLQGHIFHRDQLSSLTKLLKFLPIVGEQGNHMKRYHIQTLMRSLKKNYAHKAVRNGFDDTSIYNDRLLFNMSEDDLKNFNNLQKFVGTSRQQRRSTNKFLVNNQGLSQKDYDRIAKDKGEPKQPLSPILQKIKEKEKEARKQRSKVIPILRAMSIRIPLMIYGMNGDFNQDISLHDFVNGVDMKSWREFMPRGVTKPFFEKFIKFYDSDVFIDAGKIIRTKVKAIDKYDPLERTKKIAEIFKGFKNPDKETVLTPWRVVNMHMGLTLGGFSHFDADYRELKAPQWLKDSNSNVFQPNAHILEINSKTGLYPLYMATSLYWQKFQQINRRSGGKFSLKDELDAWYRILRNNIFVIAKTPMAKKIAIRTLVGYKPFKPNIKYEADLVERAKKHPKETVAQIEKDFNNMKFDVVIGNPPYQKNDNKTGTSASPIYQYFVNISERLSSRYVSLIMPAKWYTGGKGLTKFRAKMLNDKHIKTLFDFMTPEAVFPSTHIRGGVTIFLWDKKYDNSTTKSGGKGKDVRVINIKGLPGKKIEDVRRPLKIGTLNYFFRDIRVISIMKKIPLDLDLIKYGDNDTAITEIERKDHAITNVVSPRGAFGISTKFKHSSDFHDSPKGLEDPVRVYASKGSRGYVERNLISKHQEWIDRDKFYMSRSNNIGTDMNDDNLNVIPATPPSICTDSYVVFGAQLHGKTSVKNLAKYLNTKFARFLMSLNKVSIDASQKVYRYIPMQEFKDNNDINWDKPLDDIDQQLSDKYGLTKEEQDLIRHSIKENTHD